MSDVLPWGGPSTYVAAPSRLDKQFARSNLFCSRPPTGDRSLREPQQNERLWLVVQCDRRTESDSAAVDNRGVHIG